MISSHIKPVTIYSKKYGDLLLIEDKKIMICQMKKPYIPIEKFKKIFRKASEFIKEHKIEKFIFDKRSLETFHQPSMEWYFIIWKRDMMSYGLTEHRKILPQNEPWFQDAVQAGRAKIEKDYPDNIIKKLNIVYCQSLEEAIDK